MLRQGIPHRGIMFNFMNGYVGHNIPAIGASLDTRQFPHILMQNPYQQKEIQQMNYGDKDYEFQYEQGQSSESQQMQQPCQLEDYCQGQDEDVLPQSQEPCIEDPNIEESGTDERSDKDIFID
ncbi:unnamed protein product [Dovyalis caffra]|uniref:Uncharacterized protein n=1 Tax=Dovyalis caffra TaxID=77055 RepID=A0AAV1SCM7_9ROSI|nr:unnamed protein product [Dovyalis caffra]